MKLNNKGFAITGILYGLLILFALLVGSYLTILTARKNRLDGIVENIENEYNGNTTDTYTLTFKKDTGIKEIYYSKDNSKFTKVNDAESINVESGNTIYYYAVPKEGYTTNCSQANTTKCYVEINGKNEELTVTATPVTTKTYKLTLTKNDGVSSIWYKIGNEDYKGSSFTVSVNLENGEECSYYGIPKTEYTMNSCTLSNPCHKKMGTEPFSYRLEAAAKKYKLILNKGAGVKTIFYKINGENSYSSITTDTTLEVNYNTTYYYYGIPENGFKMDSCASYNNPCSYVMGNTTVTRTLKAIKNSPPYTVIIYLMGSEEARGTTNGSTFTATGVYTMGKTNISCDYGATATISGTTVTIANITTDTTCDIT